MLLVLDQGCPRSGIPGSDLRGSSSAVLRPLCNNAESVSDLTDHSANLADGSADQDRPPHSRRPLA